MSQEKEQYHLISLEVTGFKKIKAGGAVFNDGLTVITGKNGSGKTSLLDSIMVALGAAPVDKPINNECRRAVIELRVGSDTKTYIIERKFTETGKYLDVRDERNQKISSPQSFLNDLFTNCIDPEAFLRMKKAEQCQALRIACNCDTTLIDAEYDREFSKRTEVNRMLKQQEDTLATLGEIQVVPVVDSVGSMSSERAELCEVVQDYTAYYNYGQSLVEKCNTLNSGCESIRAQILELQNKLEIQEEQHEKACEELAASRSQFKDRNALYKSAEKRIAEIDAIMQSVDESARQATAIATTNSRIEAATELRDKFCAESAGLTVKLDELKQQKKELLELADYPIEGMYVEGNEIYINDVPLSEINTANRIAIAMHVAMSQNPKLKLVFIRNGSMLDEDSINTVKKLAIEKGFQIIMEKVSASPDGDCGIHIVEGKTEQ